MATNFGFALLSESILSMDSNMMGFSAPFALKPTYLTTKTHKSNFLSSISQTKPFNFKLESNKPRNDVAFDESAFESERLSLDAKARRSMVETSKRETDDDPKAWKWIIRKRIWDLMEARNIAQNPRPVHHRIPNFVGASIAAKNLGELEEFRVAGCVKVNPDSPQKQVRFLTLSGGKKLLTPQPRLRTGFFSVLESGMLSPSTINEACTSVGVAKYGRPIGLDEKIKVDLIVIGSVAVDPMTGARLGKGENLEFAVADNLYLKVVPMKRVTRIWKERQTKPKDDLNREETPIQILDDNGQELGTKKINLVQVLWRNHSLEKATWEWEDEM
ncbi:hypothetical protein Q3G72_027762 [Acer saccharum]|nr:hypothetical protein Q3G72_027762 [Acer saccharum]